jgi:thioredoxin 1
MPVLYFSMANCGPCKTFQPIVQKTSSQLGVSVNYLDVNINGDLAQKYNISSVPTLIVTDPSTGDVQYRSSGVLSATQLNQVLVMAK